jgi:hypothetical protein
MRQNTQSTWSVVLEAELHEAPPRSIWCPWTLELEKDRLYTPPVTSQAVSMLYYQLSKRHVYSLSSPLHIGRSWKADLIQLRLRPGTGQNAWGLHTIMNANEMLLVHSASFQQPKSAVQNKMIDCICAQSTEQTRLFPGQTVVKCMYGPASTYENKVAISWLYFWPHFGDHIYHIVLPYAQALHIKTNDTLTYTIAPQ